MRVSRPRVLYASFDAVPAPKGASNHILQTVRGISAHAGVDLVTLPGTLAGAPLPPDVNHLTVSPGEGNFLQRALEFGDAVARRILAGDYAAVHVRSIWEGTPARLLQPRRGYRLVYEANGLPSIELRYHYPAVASHRDLLSRLRAQERALLRAAHLVITQSRTTARFLRDLGAPADRVRVIPNGVDAERFAVPARAVPAGPPRILYLGTLAPWQGIALLLHAVRLVVDERPACLDVVGTGRHEWRKEYERLIRKLDLGEHVSLLPAVPPEEVPALLAESDVCTAPLAITERNVIQGCCPLKVLEYMAAGRPIVASRLPALCEVLTHEETALLVKPDKPRRLADALLRLLSDPDLAGRLGAAAAQVARDRYSWHLHNTAVSEAYAEMLSQ